MLGLYGKTQILRNKTYTKIEALGSFMEAIWDRTIWHNSKRMKETRIEPYMKTKMD